MSGLFYKTRFLLCAKTTVIYNFVHCYNDENKNIYTKEGKFFVLRIARLVEIWQTSECHKSLVRYQANLLHHAKLCLEVLFGIDKS